ncbi:acyltransferase 3 [Hyphomicrobium denitrificans 1NES1]|uniref:Acyltransferase 3 n=1 Tax=Hyphomicrobium denitrificans 1NES1 TaxID=670307 RepID=N0BG69_9HYPH|nr:acyltransferase family protein [Hyphomicrobium denitrificans]AGK59110.1 acyltransferase 3 [Hyphomicrobium denitrificans 1NES1]
MGDANLRYRPELDGLRAVAVVAVFLCHLGMKSFSGGYVGVDVFFVLSGFLISHIIADDLRAGRFSIASFYERRIRRIVPALVFVGACSTVAAVAVLLPDELKAYAASLLAAALSVSNVWFANMTGYFDPAAATQPLLHTWSLGVEEQFYVVFPLLLSLAYRFGQRGVSLLVCGALPVSLAMSIALTPEDPRSAYFLIHTRAWELLMGSVVALGLVRPPRETWHRETASALGLLGIALAVLFFNDKTPFPGYAALLPCLGAALVIWAGGGTLAARCLSFKPMVFIGLISYSLYLWHWPLIVFAKLLLVQPFTPSQQLLLICAATGLSVLTWRFVETPFRRRVRAERTRKMVFAGGGLSLGALAIPAAVLVSLQGMPNRFPAEILGIAAASQDTSPKRTACHFDGTLAGDFDKSCVLGAPVAPTAIVYGDSHGAELSVALGELAEPRNESVRELTASGCPPALDFTYPSKGECPGYNARMIEHLVSLAPTTIIVATNAIAWTHEYPTEFTRGLDSVLRALSAAGHRVIVLGQVPPHPNQLPVPATLARKAMLGTKPDAYAFQPDMKALQDLDATLDKIASAAGTTYISLLPTLCNENECKAAMDGAVLYFDDNHLTVAGEKLIAAKLLAPVLWPAKTATESVDGQKPAALP